MKYNYIYIYAVGLYSRTKRGKTWYGFKTT